MALSSRNLRLLPLPAGAPAHLPEGLDAHEPVLARALRLAHDEWDENRAAKRPDPAIHREWLRFVLEEALGYPREIILAGRSPQPAA